MEFRFQCTACGKCCHGWIPLTIEDALTHAHRFPLAVVWTTVRPGGRSYAWASRLGTTVEVRRHKPVALRVSPTAYIPPSMSCPALAPDGLCGIHEGKPARCRAMPFSPYHDEADQADLLRPKPGWACDTSSSAPVVYRGAQILARDDYESELAVVRSEAPVLRSYAEWNFRNVPEVAERLTRVATRPGGGHLVLDFTTLITRLPKVDIADFASRQRPVLEDFLKRTAGLPELADYHAQYRASLRALAQLSPSS